MKKINFEEAIKALEEGKKVYNNPNISYFKIDKGVLCRYSDIKRQGEIVGYNSNIEHHFQYYLPEEPKPFEITETGLYKTGLGKKAFVYRKDDDYNIWYFVVEGDFDRWKCCHRGYTAIGARSKNDIIGKWGDDV